MLVKRIVTSLLVVTLAYLVTFFFPNWSFALLASTLIGLALSEYFDMVAKKGIFVYKYFGIIAGMAVPLVMYLQRNAGGHADLDPFFIVLACLLAFILYFIRRDSTQALVSIAVTMMGLLYIGWFFSFFIKLKFLESGERLVAYLILVTKSNDIGAYFIGRLFGRHGLIPRISPSKTVEGTVGGFLFGLAVSFISKTFLPSFSYMNLAILGILLGVLGQTGDLAESLLKRDCGVKDAGRNLSGFGGVFDLIDSLIFTAPIFYFYVTIFMR